MSMLSMGFDGGSRGEELGGEGVWGEVGGALL